MKWVGENGETIEKEIFDFPDGGVLMGMYNLDKSQRKTQSSRNMTAVSKTSSKKSMTQNLKTSSQSLAANISTA